MKNKYGLDRYIDADTRRKIRQNSKFSCVICRAPFCTYEHFDPEFKDAKTHDPDGMCLLCPSCQSETTAGRLSKEVIKTRYAARKAEKRAESRKENFIFFDRMPTVKLGHSTVKYADTIICTDTTDCLSFRRDQETGTFLINMAIFDVEGKEVFRISENTWTSTYEPWDFEFKGKVITFSCKPRGIIFQAVLDSSANIVEITHLDMILDRSRVRIENGTVLATRWSIDRTRAIEVGVKFFDMAGRAAVFLDNREDVPYRASNIPVLHGAFGGITIGRGASVLLESYSIRVHGIIGETPPTQSSQKGPREAYVQGMLTIRNVKFPFWSEKEYILNGVILEDEPHSVDDIGFDEHGGSIELFHIGARDAKKFDASNGLVATTKDQLLSPPKRPHSFL